MMEGKLCAITITTLEGWQSIYSSATHERQFTVNLRENFESDFMTFSRNRTCLEISLGSRISQLPKGGAIAIFNALSKGIC